MLFFKGQQEERAGQLQKPVFSSTTPNAHCKTEKLNSRQLITNTSKEVVRNSFLGYNSDAGGDKASAN